AAVERFTVRPEAATFLLLATYLLVLERATLGLRALAALVVLQVVWANLHALSVLGLVVLGAELASVAAARWLPLPPGWRHASRRDGRAVAGLAAATAAAIALGFALATVLVVSGDYYRASRLTRTFGLGVSGLLFPAGAVDFLDAAAPSARLFNDDVLGGYLLWRDYPRRRVFIDGRFQVY